MSRSCHQGIRPASVSGDKGRAPTQRGYEIPQSGEFEAYGANQVQVILDISDATEATVFNQVVDRFIENAPDFPSRTDAIIRLVYLGAAQAVRLEGAGEQPEEYGETLPAAIQLGMLSHDKNVQAAASVQAVKLSLISARPPTSNRPRPSDKI